MSKKNNYKPLVEEKVEQQNLFNAPAQETVEEPVKNDIQDISLNLNKQKFRIDNDSSRILELDTSDLGVITRLNEYYPKLKELENEIAKFNVDPKAGEEKVIEATANKLKSVDAKMRKYIDEIFDANVSEVCAPWGTMYDPVNGQLRYEHIIALISSLYEKNLAAETKKIKSKISKYTNKYTN